MYYHLSCLMVDGPGLTEMTRDALFCAACTMAKEGSKRMVVDEDGIRALVQTDFCEAFVSTSLQGIIFSAVLMTPSGETKTKYVVTREILEAGYDNSNNRIWIKTPQGDPANAQFN